MLEKMCLISSHELAKFRATLLANVQRWESTGRTVRRAFVDEVWKQRARCPGKSAQLLEAALHYSRKLLIFFYLLKVHHVETAFLFSMTHLKESFIFFCTCLKNLIYNSNITLVRREKHVL